MLILILYLPSLNKIEMFGMDMALGAGMMDMGAMDMGMGAMDMRIGEMDMAMGRPLLGAEMMGIGAMDMGIGAMDMGMGMGMMERGMIERDMMMGGMGMGMGMGYGMMGGGIGICPPGCMMACCRPVVVCPPGCMGPCCVNKQVIVRTVPSPQYNNNSGFVQLPPVQRAQAQQQINADIQQQIASEQTRIERQKQQQILYQKRIEQEQLQLQRQKLEFQQKQIQQQKCQQIRLQQLQERQRLEKIQIQQQTLMQAQYKTEKQASFAVEGAQNPYGADLLFQGNIYQQNFGKWQQIRAQLTFRMFLGFNIETISKIKIKCETHIPNFRIIKLTFHGKGDVFISVPSQDQADWMCRIIWAHFNKLNRPFNQNQSFNGCFEGEILRKSFFAGWEAKFGLITGSGLKISNGMGGPVVQMITAVPEIWTRFDLVHGNMLIVKMHVNGRKTEIGIPFEHAMAWLKGLYTLVRI